MKGLGAEEFNTCCGREQLELHLRYESLPNFRVAYTCWSCLLAWGCRTSLRALSYCNISLAVGKASCSASEVTSE
eukprot:1325547-Amphidinium_carterae.3